MSDTEKTAKSDDKSAAKFPTAVVVTLIICATIFLLTVVSLIFGGIMANKFIDNLPDKMPDSITVQFR